MNSIHETQKKKAITVNSFFTGIGGFDLGFERAGFKINFQCEKDEFCEQILKGHWPKVDFQNDIRLIQSKDIPEANVWCGGFPCQDVSVARGANEREGLKGKNSGLFYDFLKLVEQNKPKIVLLENVTGLLNSHKGKDFKIILESFTELGYGVSWRVLNTRYFGVPQSRPRVYICAWLGSIEKATKVLHEFDGSIKPNKPRLGFLKCRQIKELGISVPDTAYCLAATSGRHTGTDWSRTYVSYHDKVRRLTPIEAEKLQGFPVNWTIPKNREKEITELDTLRYHAIGNAVSVPVIEWIANRISKTFFEVNGYASLPAFANKYKDFTEIKINQISSIEPDEKGKFKWNTGGAAFKDKIISSKVHSCPINHIESRLVDIIARDVADNKYFLSPKAAEGILRRVTNQNRVLFQPLHLALERLSEKPENFKNLIL